MLESKLILKVHQYNKGSNHVDLRDKNQPFIKSV
jgi:hypothetical protein